MISFKSLAAGFLASAAFAVPVIAAEIEAVEPTTPGFSLARSEELLTENVEPAPSPAMKLGEMEILLEKTSLTQIAATFGGVISTSNKENAGISWLCYATPATATAPASLTWFAADGVMSTNYGVNYVITEIAPAGTTPTCAAPSVPLELTTDFPALGAPVADVTAKIPGLDGKDDGVLSYGGEAPLPAYLDLKEGATGRVVNYAITAGKVTATTVMQVSSN
jgi:hypothetical protein